MISFIGAFFLINFLVFIGAEARSLLEKHHMLKAESSYGRDPVPTPPSPSSSPPSDFLMATSTTDQDHEHIISDHQLLISLPTSSNYQERIVRCDYHLPPPKPADHTGQQIITSSSSHDDHDRMNINNGKPHISPPPAPKPADHTGQTIITSSNSYDDHDHMNINYGRPHKSSPPTPKPADHTGQEIITSSNSHDDHDHMNINYGRPQKSPPTPKPADHTGQKIITSSNSNEDHDHMNINYGRPVHKSPPPTPKPSDEQGQIIITFSTYFNDNSNNFGRGKGLPPPAPEYNPPYHQVTSEHATQGLKPKEYPSDTSLASF